MPKLFSLQEKKTVRDLSAQGYKPKDIAAHMAEKYPHWRAKNAYRSVTRILEEAIEKDSKTLDEMPREERFIYIENKLQTTPRFRLAFKNFSLEEKSVFVDEYLSIIKSTETLTEVEEQALFASVLELILAFQALARKEREEKYYEDSLEGKIQPSDVKYRSRVDDKYQHEYDSHMKLYQKGMEQLKMSRSQRLKEIKTQRATLIDLANELSSKNVQSEVADEIERLSKLKDEELKRLIDNGHILGVFEAYS